MPQLIFYVESGYPEIYNLLTRKTTVGRDEANDIHLNDPRVSDHHAELVRKGAGAYELIDLNSDNGTAVNSKLVDEVVLNDGDQIKFGSINAAYVDQSESVEDKLLRETTEKDLEIKSRKLAKIEEAIEARTNVLNSIPLCENKLEGLEREFAELDLRLKREQNNFRSVQGEITDCEKKQGELQTEIGTKIKELEDLEKDRADLQLDYRRVHTANENSVRLKEELDGELGHLRKEIDLAKTALKENIQAHEEAKAVIEEAKVLQARMDEFDAGLKSRETSYNELGEKIADRESTCEKLEEKIADRNRELEELTLELETKYRAAEELSKVIVENNDQIKSSSEMLENMESTLKKEIDEVSRSQETQESLQKESLSLSSLISGKTAILHRLNDKFNSRKNGSEEIVTCPPLRVINPMMRSLVQYFQHGAGVPDQDRVNPIGYYGLAACTRGSMHREAETIPAGDDPVLVLLHGDLDKDKTLIESISRDMPHRVLLVCWREGQLDALATEREQEPESLPVGGLLSGVSGIVSVDSRTAEIIDALKVGRPHLNLLLPSPVELPDWNIQVPNDKRPSGIFVSVNGFDSASKLHRGRLELLNYLVAETGTTVTLYQPNPDSGLSEGLELPGKLVTKLTTPVKYSECLERMRKHHFVMGFGKNQDGGDVMSDALLSRSVFIGGDFNNVIEQLLFPDYCIKGENIKKALKNSKRLVSDQAAYFETVEQAQSLAAELISFETVSDRLRDFFHSMTSKTVEREPVGAAS